jgi:hypothetical protein
MIVTKKSEICGGRPDCILECGYTVLQIGPAAGANSCVKAEE